MASTGHVGLSGNLAGYANVAAIQHEASRDGGHASMVLHVQDARLRVLNAPQAYSRMDGAGPANHDVRHPLPIEVMEDRAFTGSLTAETVQDHAVLRLLGPADGQTFRIPLRLDGFGNLSSDLPNWDDHANFYPVVEGRTLGNVDASLGGLTSQNATGGPFQASAVALAFGAKVSLDDASGHREIQTGESPRYGRMDPTGLLDADRLERVFVLLTASDMQIQLSSASSQGWHYDVRSMQGHLDGTAAFQAGTTSTSIDRRLLQDHLGLLEVSGALDLLAVYEEGGSRWDLAGQASAVSTNGQVVFSTQSNAVVAVAGALGLTGLLVALLRYGRDFLALAGFCREVDVMSSTRQKLIQCLAIHPGATVMGLARMTGLQRSTVRFHVRVLTRVGLIVSHREGRFEHFHLATPSASPNAAPTSVEAPALAAIADPSRQQIVRTLANSPAPVTHEELTTAWARLELRPIPRTLFLHHAAKLEKAGVLERSRRGRATSWSLTAQDLGADAAEGHQRDDDAAARGCAAQDGAQLVAGRDALVLQGRRAADVLDVEAPRERDVVVVEVGLDGLQVGVDVVGRLLLLLQGRDEAQELVL